MTSGPSPVSGRFQQNPQADEQGYTREGYMKLIRKLRNIRPEITITSDVMVGFSGKSDEDLQLTLDLMTKIEFDKIFSFKYSDRKGTRAEKKGITLKKTRCL